MTAMRSSGTITMHVPEGLESSYAAARAHLDEIGLAEVLRQIPVVGFDHFRTRIFLLKTVHSSAHQHVADWINEWIEEQQRTPPAHVFHDDISLDDWRRKVRTTWPMYKLY